MRSCATVSVCADVVRAGTSGMTPPLALEAVALGAGELDEGVRAGGHLRRHLRGSRRARPPAAWIVSVFVCSPSVAGRVGDDADRDRDRDSGGYDRRQDAHLAPRSAPRPPLAHPPPSACPPQSVLRRGTSLVESTGAAHPPSLGRPRRRSLGARRRARAATARARPRRRTSRRRRRRRCAFRSTGSRSRRSPRGPPG